MSNVSEQDGFVHFWIYISNIKSKKKVAETEIGSLVAHSLFLNHPRGEKDNAGGLFIKLLKQRRQVLPILLALSFYDWS